MALPDGGFGLVLVERLTRFHTEHGMRSGAVIVSGATTASS